MPVIFTELPAVCSIPVLLDYCLAYSKLRMHLLNTCKYWVFSYRVFFFSAKPSEELIFKYLRAEAVANQDIIVLPSIWESYHNITHQTLEVLRFAAADRFATHVLKVKSQEIS